MSGSKKYDFEGWATRNDLKCADGRVIRSGAFKVNDGQRVPMVWGHQHNSVGNVLGHALLENRPEGVYAYCSFNETPAGKHAREVVIHGDVNSLSIWANQLQQVGSDVVHGVIREVSLVLAGANPGAFIESVLAHDMPMEDDDDEGIFYNNDKIVLIHAEEGNENKGSKSNESENDETVAEVFNSMTDKQKAAVGIILGQAVEEAKKESNDGKEKNEMKHNVFSDGQVGSPVLSHDDMKKIVEDGKRCGSLRAAVEMHLEEGGILAHAVDTTGMTTPSGNKPSYGVHGLDMLFPDYKALNNKPEFISRNMGWVSKVMARVHHTPFSRIKSVYADITEDDARAKGYMKGKLKKEEVFSLLKRTTDPQTIYKKQKIDRDDVLDITDFDVLAWIKAEMRMMLDEEIARAILIGDGRLASSDDKIKEDHVRPVIKDVALYNVKVVVKVSKNASEEEVTKKLIDAIIRSRKKYKGSGSPDFWANEDFVTDMLLLEDGIGHKLYKTESELSTTLRVNEIISVEPMSELVVDGLELVGTIVNLSDYNVGADKGGEVNMFDDFDIDYNQQKYLIETRISGALIKPFSAITIYVERSNGSTSDDSEE